jgi:hypothetical protein
VRDRSDIFKASQLIEIAHHESQNIKVPFKAIFSGNFQRKIENSTNYSVD